VNADVRRYVKLAGEGGLSSGDRYVLSSVDKRDVGRLMLTKALGSGANEDLVGRYKAAEGSHLERASLLRAS
jgi:hypothetical protein